MCVPSGQPCRIPLREAGGCGERIIYKVTNWQGLTEVFRE
jgi:hypothetical protein